MSERNPACIAILLPWPAWATPYLSFSPEVPLRPFFLFATAVCVTLSSAACASTAPQAATTGTARANPDVISKAEIQASAAGTAHELVQRLRAHWLRTGAIGSMGGGRSQMRVTLVYVDGVQMGTVSALRTIPADGITSMRWLDASRAVTTFPDAGRTAINGAIVISTRQ